MSSHVHIGLYDALREAGASEEKALAALATLPFPQHLATKEDLLKAIGEVKTDLRRSENRLGGSQIRGLHLRRVDSRLARQAGVLPVALIRSANRRFEQRTRQSFEPRLPVSERTPRRCKNYPFPLALHCAGSVLAVKGPLRRFAPWTAPGRSEGLGCLRGKRGLGFRAVSGPKGNFRPYQPPEPQRWGGVTRRAVAERRRRGAGLTCPGAEAIRGFGFGFLI